MISFSGNRLAPNGYTYLSDLLPDNYAGESIRVTGLKSGQTFVVDVAIDGGYKHPDKPTKPGWVSPDGKREGVHVALLTLARSSGFALAFEDKAELRNSRGRGLSMADCSGFEMDDAWVRGARTAGIALQNCTDFTARRPVTVDTSNYQTERTDVERWNVAGSIKLDGCLNYKLIDPISIAHMGNGITATESANGEWVNPLTLAVHGANQYINASPGHTVRGGLAVGGTPTNKPPAYVVNSEKENEGASEGVTFRDCFALDASWGLGFWGNEKKAGVVIEEASFLSGILVAEDGVKFHSNAMVKRFDDTGTLFVPLDTMAPAQLAELRTRADQLAAKVRDHADWDAIIDARIYLETGLLALRVPAPTPEELRQAWENEGEMLLAEVAAWWTKRGAWG